MRNAECGMRNRTTGTGEERARRPRDSAFRTPHSALRAALPPGPPGALVRGRWGGGRRLAVAAEDARAALGLGLRLVGRAGAATRLGDELVVGQGQVPARAGVEAGALEQLAADALGVLRLGEVVADHLPDLADGVLVVGGRPLGHDDPPARGGRLEAVRHLPLPAQAGELGE